MLPTFRLRDVRRSSSSPPPASHSNLRLSSREPLVKLTAPEYDNTITGHPEATLKYVDEDDGEIVTVGTSLELSQRLEDPLPRNGNPTQRHHIFDIDRKQDVVKIWQSFAERTSGIDGKDRPRKFEMYNAHPNGLGSHTRSAIEAVTKSSEQHVWKGNDIPKPDDVEERRKQYFRACDPPQLQDIKSDDASSSLFPDPKHSVFTTSTRETMGLPDSTAMASILTHEGKRQARAAGEKMRAFPPTGRASSASDHLDYQNRWASYNHSKLSISSEHGPVQSITGNSHQRQAQWAGDKIRGRTNRMRHVKSSIELPDQDSKKLRSSANDKPLAVHFKNTTPLVRNTAEKKSKNGASNLLQVFNSAFDQGTEAGAAAKAAKANNCPAVTEPCEYSIYLDSRNKKPSPEPSPSQQISQSIKQSVDEVDRVVSELNLQTSTFGNSQLAKQVAQSLENGLKDALSKFEICLKSIARSAQEASNATEKKTPLHTDPDIGDSGDSLPGSIQNVADSLLSSHSQSGAQLASAGCRTPQQQESVSLGKQASPMCGPGRTSSLRYQEPVPIHSSKGDTSISDQLVEAALSKAHASTLQDEFTLHPGESAAEAGYRHGMLRRNLLTSSGQYYVSLDDSTPPGASIANAPIEAPTGIDTRGLHVAPWYDPSSEAFPGNNDLSAPRFPSLPSMEPLQPQSAPRSYEIPASNADHRVQQGPASHVPGSASLTGPLPATESSHENPSQRIPNQISLPGDISPSTCPPFPSESSGKFFNRMTGRDAGAVQFEASMGNPDGLRRSATAAGLHNKYTTSSRRPYSINYDGNGRLPWTDFLSPRPPPSPPASDRATIASSHRTRDLSPSFSMPGAFPPTKVIIAEHPTDASLLKARNCAKHLQDLGFGDVVEGGPERLMVYAEAAEGDLVNAIDMIDEEQKVYKELRFD